MARRNTRKDRPHERTTVEDNRFDVSLSPCIPLPPATGILAHIHHLRDRPRAEYPVIQGSVHTPHPPPLRNHLRTVLRRSPLFRGLDDKLIDSILAQGTQRAWAKGEALESPFFSNEFCVLAQGRAQVVGSVGQNDKRFVLFVLGAGDGYDFVPLLDGHPHETHLECLEETLAVSFSLDLMRHWLQDNPDLNRNFLPYLGECMRTLEALATDLAMHDTLTRLARLILRHLDQEAAKELDGTVPVRLIHDLTHERLAQMIGSVRQVVNRHLRQLHRAGIAENQEGSLFVHDLEALKAIAEGVHRRLGNHRHVD